MSRPFAEIAEEAGAADVFVFRRVADDQWANLGGWGRGAGWAGNVRVRPDSEPFVAEAATRGIARHDKGVPSRVFGPYWTATAAAAHVGDTLVVFGGDRLADLDDAELRAAAERAAGQVAEISIDKQAADEAEVAQAVASVAEVPAGTAEEVARQVASRAATALSCEFAAVLLPGDRPRVVVGGEGWRPAASDAEVALALLPLVPAAGERPLVEQDLSRSPLAVPPLSFDDGLVSRCTVPIGPGARHGLLVVAHAGSTPRGFTSLCQRVAHAIGEAAAEVLARR